MELLDFARGPALAASLAILASGIAWRLFGIARIPRRPDFSEPRSTATAAGAMRGILSRMLPYREFRSAATFSAANGYVYHIGLALIAFAYWLPFGKLAHAFLVFVSRGTTGAAAAHRGTLP